jgi:hypothetical protein
VTPTTPQNGFFSGLVRWLLDRVWYVHSDVVFTVKATPTVCLQTIAAATKPSLKRLHHRNLFTDGRRYILTPLKDGFHMICTSKVPWSYRRRTRMAALLRGTLTGMGEDSSRVYLRARMSVWYLLDSFVLPAWMSALVVMSPWPRSVEVTLALTLFALSWIGHRYHAILQASEIVYFVQIALEDLEAVPVPLLPASQEDVVRAGDFEAEWEKFYQAHKDEDNS